LKNKQIIKIVQWLWIVFVLLAGGYYLITRWSNITDYVQAIPVINIFISAMFFVIGKLLFVFLSKDAIQAEGGIISYRDAFKIVSLTQLGKYLPGGVWHFVARFNVYHSRDLTMKKSGKALIIESIWLVCGALAFGLSVYLISFNSSQGLLSKVGINLPLFLRIGIAILLIGLWFAVLYVVEKFFVSCPRPQKVWIVLKLMLIQFGVWLTFGLSFAFLFHEIDFSTILLAVSVFALSWAIGYIVIFAPGGIGVRELALAWFLNGMLLAGQAVILATVHRVLFTAVEVALGIVAGLMSFSVPGPLTSKPTGRIIQKRID